MDANRKAPIIIFIHLPKCGGTTLNRLIQWEYSPLKVFCVDGRFYRWSWNKLIRSRVSNLAAMQIFEGHMPFGLHTRLEVPSTYMTVLREPIDRVISEYYYRVNRWQHPWEDRWITKLSLEQYIRTTPQHNIQTKLIAGESDGYDFLAGKCTAATLARAKENLLRHFSLIGLTERFDESLALAKLTFGWEIRHYAAFNVTALRLSRDRIPEAVCDLIAERYQHDVALYEYAVALFKERVAARSVEVRCEVERILRARALGSLESRWYRVGSWARQTLSRLNSARLIAWGDSKISLAGGSLGGRN